MSQSLTILVVGAGELGEAILSALVSHPSRPAGTQVDVLLRKESITSPSSPSKQASNSRFRSLGAALVPGNFVDGPVSSLAEIFKKYNVVIQAGGYGLPKETQIKSTTAPLQAGVSRYLWVPILPTLETLSVWLEYRAGVPLDSHCTQYPCPCSEYDQAQK